MSQRCCPVVVAAFSGGPKGERAAKETHQGTEPGPMTAGFYIRRQHSAGACGAAVADQTVQPVLDDQRRDLQDLDHLIAHRLWILAL